MPERAGFHLPGRRAVGPGDAGHDVLFLDVFLLAELAELFKQCGTYADHAGTSSLISFAVNTPALRSAFQSLPFA